MNKREIIERCIEAYSEAIEVCKSLELDEAKYWLRGRMLHLGVCLYAEHVLSQFIVYEYWVKRNESGFSAYWTSTPRTCDTHDELMESLTTRLDILKRELSIPE